jgi:hypothetical protein
MLSYLPVSFSSAGKPRILTRTILPVISTICRSCPLAVVATIIRVHMRSPLVAARIC